MKRKCPWAFSMGRREVSLASLLASSKRCRNSANPKALMDSSCGEEGKLTYLTVIYLWNLKYEIGPINKHRGFDLFQVNSHGESNLCAFAYGNYPDAWAEDLKVMEMRC